MPDGRRSLLAIRDFRLFFVGNLVSSSGTWLQNVAQGVLVLQLTGRSVMVGVTQGATFVPVLLLALHGGRLADRFERRRLLVGSQVVAALATAVLAVLAATGHASVGAIIAVAVVLGIQYAVAIPASQALVPSLVPPEQLGPAIGLSSVTYNLARAIGPLLSTVAIALLGFGLAFGLNALSFVALAVAVALIRPRPRPAGAEAPGTIREGLAYAWTNRRLRGLLLVVTAVSFATDPVFTLSPALAESIFGRTASDAGLLVAAFGGGAILAAATLGRFLRGQGRPGVIGPASLGVLLLGMAGVAASPVLWAGLAALALGGVGYLLTITIWTTAIQREVDDRLRGRVMAIWTLAFLGSRPIAAVLDGALADAFGPRLAVLLMSVPLLIVGLLLVPGLGRRRGEPQPDTEGGPPAGAVRAS